MRQPHRSSGPWKLAWIAVLLLTGIAVAQQTAAGGPTAQNDATAQQPSSSQEGSVMLSSLLAATNAELPALETASEVAPTNNLSGAVMFGSAYDDNLLNSDPARGGGVTYLFAPRFRLQITRPRTAWNVVYSPGVSRSNVGDTQDFMTHDFSTELTRRMSRQWTVRARTQFSVTSNPFQIVGSGNSLDGGISDPRNEGILTPFAKQTTLLTGLDTTYQLGKSDYVGASGVFSTLQFDNLNGVRTDLANRNGVSAQGFYARRLSSRNLVGVEYKFQQLRFSPLHSVTYTHSVLYFHAININPSWTVSFFAGPERADSSGEFAGVVGTVPSQIDWNVSSGAIVAWQGRTDDIRASFSRRVTDGGGLASSMRQNTLGIDYRHLFTRRWAFTVGARFDEGRALVSAAPKRPIRTAGGGFGLERNLTESLALQFGYERIQQQMPGTDFSSKAVHNRGTISLVYQFNRPLGR